MESSYRRNLINQVLTASQSSFWDSAVQEWVIEDCQEDNSVSSVCICGKENLRYLYTIYNKLNGNRLDPIGSCCIKKFNRDDMDEVTSVMEDMLRLLHAIRDGVFITLTPDFFSRKLLKKLLNDGAFIPNSYNHYDGYNDYQFMLDMFNKRDKGSITSLQQRKINGIIVGSIRPYLEGQLATKIHE